MLPLSPGATHRLPGCQALSVGAPFDMWQIDLTQAPNAPALAWLAPEERGRAARFHREADRVCYLAAHVALRRLLGDRVGLLPGALRFVRSDDGKPAVANATGVRFSLSYGKGVGLIGIGAGREIGVDIEGDAQTGFADIAPEYLSPWERAAWEGAGGESDRLFLQAWTRKEACLKAAGLGLRRHPATVETGLGPGISVALLSPARLVEVGSFNLNGHVAAWARLL